MTLNLMFILIKKKDSYQYKELNPLKHIRNYH